MNTMETVDNIQVNKHVAAVHCSNNISLLQRKIFNALLFKAYPQLLKEDFHYISLSELSTLIDYNSKDSAKLKQALIKNVGSVVMNIARHSPPFCFNPIFMLALI